MIKIEKSRFDSFGNLGVLQFSLQDFLGFDCVPGPEYLEKGLVVVTETSQAGEVNRLRVQNLSSDWVLFTDSDLLKGAKQNRVLNASALLAPQKEYVIDVSCVERGRWSRQSSPFGTSGRQYDPSLRKNKSRDVLRNVRQSRRHHSDQL